MAIQTLDQRQVALGAAQLLPVSKSASGITVATFQARSTWTMTGLPAAGVAPAGINGAICTSATAGAIPWVDPAAGLNAYLDAVIASLRTTTAGLDGEVTLYDRLWASGGINGTTTGPQAVTQPALTRYSDGSGVQAWVEVYTSIGATAATLTVTYTNQDGVGSRTGTIAIATGGVSNAQMAFGPMALQAGDRGVRSIQSINLSATTGAAGNYGVTLARPLASALIVNGAAQIRPLETFSVVQPGACLWLAYRAATSAVHTLAAQATVVTG